MSNVNTDHSRKLRHKTAAEWNKKLTAANKFEVRSKDEAAIAAIKAGLAEIPGKNNAEKLLLLLDVYKKSPK